MSAQSSWRNYNHSFPEGDMCLVCHENDPNVLISHKTKTGHDHIFHKKCMQESIKALKTQNCFLCGEIVNLGDLFTKALSIAKKIEHFNFKGNFPLKTTIAAGTTAGILSGTAGAVAGAVVGAGSAAVGAVLGAIGEEAGAVIGGAVVVAVIGGAVVVAVIGVIGAAAIGVIGAAAGGGMGVDNLVRKVVMWLRD